MQEFSIYMYVLYRLDAVHTAMFYVILNTCKTRTKCPTFRARSLSGTCSVSSLFLSPGKDIGSLICNVGSGAAAAAAAPAAGGGGGGGGGETATNEEKKEEKKEEEEEESDDDMGFGESCWVGGHMICGLNHMICVVYHMICGIFEHNYHFSAGLFD